MSKKNESKTSAKRRAALRKLVISGGVVGTATWTKPVVESIVMPAHAHTSDPLRDPCIIEIVPVSSTTYNVRVSGQVEGPNNSGVPINISVTTGGQTFNDSTSTDGSGNYGPITLGTFDICIDSSDPVATVSSPSISDTAVCTVAHGKNIAFCT